MSSGTYEPKEQFSLENHAGESSNFNLIQRLQALANASLSISSELDLNTVLQRIADTAREFANAKYAALGIVNEQGVISSIYYQRDFSTRSGKYWAAPPWSWFVRRID